ncbi:TlpA disulfide reductase family protein [Flavobacterium sp.]|uniref:TlpA family protein disulfide reductase n=1 Tax=Flavobacterium sp. TaxID=239 RepID=UPI00286CEA71|nr:TlpA disulfide reductase family protein [Flavobacterium sp.]
MKKLILTTFLITTLNCFSQTEYYSTNGKNRLTKAELDVKTSELKTKYEKISNKEVFVEFNIDNTETKTDSIIHFVKFEINDPNASKGPLSEYVGKKLPEMILTDINGKKIPINKLNGKPTLINFWFTTCAPCIDEMPILNKIYDEYTEKYNFIAITYESKKQVDKFLKTHLYKFLHIVDAREFTDKLQLKSYPVNLFLDKDGIVKYSEYGIPYEQDENGKIKIGDGKDFIKKLEKLK